MGGGGRGGGRAPGSSGWCERVARVGHSILRKGLQVRDRRQQRELSAHGVAVARGGLEVRMDRALDRRYRSPQNRRLATHLLRGRDALFTFLSCPGLEATNWR